MPFWVQQNFLRACVSRACLGKNDPCHDYLLISLSLSLSFRVWKKKKKATFPLSFRRKKKKKATFPLSFFLTRAVLVNFEHHLFDLLLRDTHAEVLHNALQLLRVDLPGAVVIVPAPANAYQNRLKLRLSEKFRPFSFGSSRFNVQTSAQNGATTKSESSQRHDCI